MLILKVKHDKWIRIRHAATGEAMRMKCDLDPLSGEHQFVFDDAPQFFSINRETSLGVSTERAGGKRWTSKK